MALLNHQITNSSKMMSSVQVQVTFSTTQRCCIVFAPFGEISAVQVKQDVCSTSNKQSGHAFVNFFGRDAANAAVKVLNDVTVEAVLFNCKITSSFESEVEKIELISDESYDPAEKNALEKSFLDKNVPVPPTWRFIGKTAVPPTWPSVYSAPPDAKEHTKKRVQECFRQVLLRLHDEGEDWDFFQQNDKDKPPLFSQRDDEDKPPLFFFHWNNKGQALRVEFVHNLVKSILAMPFHGPSLTFVILPTNVSELLVLYECDGILYPQTINSEELVEILGIEQIMKDTPELGDLKSPPRVCDETFEVWFKNDVEIEVAMAVAQRFKRNMIHFLASNQEELEKFVAAISLTLKTTITLQDLLQEDRIHIEIRKGSVGFIICYSIVCHIGWSFVNIFAAALFSYNSACRMKRRNAEVDREMSERQVPPAANVNQKNPCLLNQMLLNRYSSTVEHSYEYRHPAYVPSGSHRGKFFPRWWLFPGAGWTCCGKGAFWYSQYEREDCPQKVCDRCGLSRHTPSYGCTGICRYCGKQEPVLEVNYFPMIWP